MASSHHFWLLLLSYLAGIHFSAQDEPCVPGPVVDMTLNGNNTLTWRTSPDEECAVSRYLVHIATLDGTIEFSYIVLFPFIHIQHLIRCQGYTFRVFQISSDNITGSPWSFYTVTPPDADANLRLDYVRITQTGRNVRLQWSLEDEYIQCARHYRIVVYNEDNDYAEDVYTTLTTAVVNNIVPCARYTFTVRGIFTLEEPEGPATVVRHTHHAIAADAPNLERFSVTDTTVTFSWLLEEYNKNRCPINVLIIDGSPYFNVTYTIRDQANRTPLPLRLTGLTPDTLYYLKVTANNTAGPSEPFHFSIQTLPTS